MPWGDAAFERRAAPKSSSQMHRLMSRTSAKQESGHAGGRYGYLGFIANLDFV